MFRYRATFAALQAYRGNAKEALKVFQEHHGVDKNYGAVTAPARR